MTTIRLPPDFREFLKLLAVHRARFLLIGGYAVNAFGYVRNTVDMDLWIASDGDNQQRVIAAVRDFAFPSASGELLSEEDAMLRMGTPPLRIDVLKRIAGVEFDECWSRRLVINDGDLEIPVISLADLKANKLSTGRNKDLLDVEELS